jgi:hypothetical protein
MGHLKDFQSGTSNDPFTVGSSGSLTLSYGTANGVAYLNGSKVLTTGSALTFDGSQLGIGTASGTSNGLKLNSGNAGANYVLYRATATGLLTIYGNQTGFNGLSVTGVDGDLATLTSTGLGIGTSSPSAQLQLNKTGTGDYTTFRLSNSGASGKTYEIGVGGNTATSGYANNLYFYDSTAGALRMVLDASGNLGIGTSSPLSILTLLQSADGYDKGITLTRAGANRGTIFLNASNDTLNFGRSTSTSMTLDASGNLLVGQTAITGSEALGVTKSVAGSEVVRFRATDASDPYGQLIIYPNANPNGTANEFLGCYSSGPTVRMTVRSNGGIANYAANNVILSDRREKTNFSPATSYLEKICAIPVQTFNYIDQNMEDDGGLTLGVVAQDVQAVAPELVTEGNWGSKDEPKMRLEIYHTDLQYALMKCIQEMKSIIDTQAARIAILEAK